MSQSQSQPQTLLYILLLSFVSYLTGCTAYIYDCNGTNGTTLAVNEQHLKKISEGELQFYAFDVSSQISDLHIYITPIGNCDVDVFASFSGIQCPIKTTQFDAFSRETGAEHLIITNNSYNAQQYVYITVQGWTGGRYSILYRFVHDIEEKILKNPLKIHDNIPQFFMIITGVNYNYALIDYAFDMNPNSNISKKAISFYLDSYVSNTVFFKVWIDGNKPDSLLIDDNNPHILYQHTDPSVSSLRLSSNDPKVISCSHSASDTVTCHGFDTSGKATEVAQPSDDNDEYHIYLIIEIDPSKSDMIENELQITVNDEPLNDNGTSSQCKHDCGPNGQFASEQLALFQGETMWNSLIADKNGVIQPEFFAYDYTENNDCDSIQIRIADITGFTNVYLSAQTVSSWPNSTRYTLKSDDLNANSQILTVSGASTDTYHMGVYPDNQSTKHKLVQFTITISLLDCQQNKIVWVPPVELDSGMQIVGNPHMESTDYYQYNQPVAGQNIIISIIKDFGDIDLYVDLLNISNPMPPNANTALWKDTSAPNIDDTTISKLIEIRADDSNNCADDAFPCSYGISVHCGTSYMPSNAQETEAMTCRYTITVSSAGAKAYSITTLQSSQPLNDIMRKNDDKHVYKYDYFALAPLEQTDVTITVTPINWQHSDANDVEILVSTTNPLLEGVTADIWNISGVGNTLVVHKSQLVGDESLFIAVQLSDEYNANDAEPDQFEFSIICYTTQSVKLPLETPLVRSLATESAVTFKALVDIGKDFSVFLAAISNVTNNVSGILYLSNLYNNNDPPRPGDSSSYEWSTTLSAATSLSQITVNYESNPKSCMSVKKANVTDYRCEYWITLYNPSKAQVLQCAVLGTTMFHQLNNGESIKSQVTSDDIEYTKRFVMNPQLMPFITADKTYNLIVSATVIVGDDMEMYIGDTPFADNLYSQRYGRGHDFAIGRAIPIDRSYYIAVAASPGDIFTLTATFMDVTGMKSATASILKSGVTHLSILDTKVLNKTHSCHVYVHTNTSSNTAEVTFTSVVGGERAVVFTKYVAGNVDEGADLNCDNNMFYPTLDYLFDDEAFDSDIGILFGPRDVMRYDNMQNGDFIYVNVYPLQYIQDIPADTGYYLEYRLLAYSFSDHIILSNGIPTNIDADQNISIYATIPITKKMLNAMNHQSNNHFIDVSFTKYSFGRPVIYISSLFTKPSKSSYEYVLTEDDHSFAAESMPSYNVSSANWTYTYYELEQDYKTQQTFGITIDLHEVEWPPGNDPWSTVADADSSWFYSDQGIENHNFYDDDFEIDEWIGYLYLAIRCIDGGSVSLDIQSNYVEENIVSELSYGVPMYAQIEKQNEMKYFLLHVADTNLMIHNDDNNDANATNGANGTLQISLSIISGSAELYIDDFTGNKNDFPNPAARKTYSLTTKDIKDGDINSFKVIDIDLATLLSASSQNIIIGVEATAQFTEFTITAQELTVAPTLLTINTPINGELSADTPYAIFDFVVDINNIDAVHDSLQDFYIIASALSGKIGLFINAPDKYPKIPTTAANSTYFSADLQYAFQVIYIAHADLEEIISANPKQSKSRYIYRCVVGLIDIESNARFNIVVNQEADQTGTQYISDGIPTTYILAAKQRQLFIYELSESDAGDELTITLSTIFGDPSVYIGLNMRPYPDKIATYNWSTSSWGTDSTRIKNASDGIYNILVCAGQTMSTQFTLSAVSSETEHIITNGMSLFETVYKMDTKYYIFYPTIDSKESGDIDVSIVGYSGDINIFLSNGSYKHPNGTFHDYSFQINAQDSMKSQSLSIPIEHMCDVSTFECKALYISVTPIGLASTYSSGAITYSIMVTQNIIGILSDGVSVQATLNMDNAEKLFRFTIDKDALQNHTVRFTISALRDNEAVSMVVYPTGTAQNETASIAKPMFGSSETVLIKNLCLNSPHNAGLGTLYTYNANLCVYLVRIACYNNDTLFAFNLIAATDQTFMTLQDGVTITDSITTAGTFKYYNFYVNNVKDAGNYALEIDVNPMYGDPDLYIAKDVQGNKVVTTTANYKWRSMKFGRDNIAILIRNASYLGVYQIGVYSYSVTQYELNGWLRRIIYNFNETNGGSSMVLYPGKKRYGYSSGSITCYVFNTDNTKDEEIEITVDVHEGAVNAYVALNNLPAGSVWTAQSQVTETSTLPTVIPLSPLQLQHVNKTYCCIAGDTGMRSLYEIWIDYATGLKTLFVTGSPTSHLLQLGAYDYYYVDVVDEEMGIYINVKSLTDGVTAPFVYISRSNRHPGANDSTFCGQEAELNEGSSCTMVYGDESGDRLRVILLNDVYSTGKYYISVVPDSEHQVAGMHNMTYEITASSTLSELQMGETITDTLSKSNWKYYVYDKSTDMNGDTSGNSNIPIIVTFTLLSGSTRGYVTNSVISEMHGVYSYDLINDASVQMIDNGSNNDTAIGFSGSQTIKISETSNKYFFCNVDDKIDNILYQLEDFLFDFDDEISFDADIVGLCQYDIAVRASSDSAYTLSIHYEDGLNKLKNDGTPVNGQLSAGQYAYYYCVLNGNNDKLQILLTDMDGNVNTDLRIYINIDFDNDLSNNRGDYSKPNATNSNNSSADGSIIFDTPKSGTYYIAIYAAAEINGGHYYSILATISRIVLIENYPQIINTEYYKLKGSKYPNDAGYFFSFDVLKNKAASIEFDIHSATNQNDLFTFYVTNSEIMSDCDAINNCPNPAHCEDCDILESHNVDNPVFILNNNNFHCKYNGNSKLCTYYIGIVLNAGYESKVMDSGALIFDITAKSSTSSSGVLIYDGSPIISSFDTDVNEKKEYNFYASYMPQDTNQNGVEISLETCSGDVDLYYSSNTVFPTKTTHTQQSENEDKLEVITINNINAMADPDVIYIGVRDRYYAKNKKNQKDSQYKLSVGYALNMYRAQVRSTDLSVSSLNAGEATITFKLMQRANDFYNLETDKITINGYKLYFADATNPFAMYTQCGLNKMEKWEQCGSQSNKSCFIDLKAPTHGDEYVYKKKDEYFYTRSISGFRINETYYFNVLLEIKVSNITGNDNNNNNNDRVVYTTYSIQSTQIIYTNNKERWRENGAITKYEIAFGITIPIIFCLIGLVYYYYKEHKRVVRDLSVLEMEEIAVGGTTFKDYESNNTRFISKFAKRIQEKRDKIKDKKPREKSKKYHSLLPSHDDSFDDNK